MSAKLASKQMSPMKAQTDYGVTEFRVGPDSRGPKRCLKCGQPFKVGEPWQRMTSPTDPELGAYSVGIHDRCAQASQAIAT
jgi:hypothetical protein